MPRGTYPVKRMCLCLRNSRYYNAFCPDRENHRPLWHEFDWADDPPYMSPDVRAAREYREMWMAQRRRMNQEAT